MNVLMVEPGKAPYETQIGDDLQSMQALVGGYIQAVCPYEEPVALVCNEEGKLDGLPLNRALRDSDGDIYDIVAGNFFIVGLGESDFTDLPHELAERFAEQFRQQEMFLREGDKIVAAHLGGWKLWDDVEKYLVGTPIYFDTAFTLNFITDEQLLRIIKNHGSEKILHATDSPWEKQGRMAKHLSALPLSEEDCNNIFYKNAKKLLKIG